jgi:hypothetical protein
VSRRQFRSDSYLVDVLIRGLGLANRIGLGLGFSF